MYKKIVSVVLLVCVLGLSAAAARPIVIKLGSAAPDNSIWADSLKKMANEWSEISNGQVEVKIYFAGFKDEADLIRKMKFNQLQAGIVAVSDFRCFIRMYWLSVFPFLYRVRTSLTMCWMRSVL